MAESDPYATSYAEHVKDSTHQFAAKRLRRESLSKGNRNRQQIERNAPKWRNEPNERGTIHMPGSFPGPLTKGFPGATLGHHKRQM